MSAAQLFNIPATEPDREAWVFANSDSHNNIVAAIASSKGVQLAQYVLNPVSPTALDDFLLSHQFMHDQLCSVLRIGGNDYTSLNPNDPLSVEYLWQQHANEHILAETQLGI